MHLLSGQDVEQYHSAPGLYAPPSLAREGFIHLSTVGQVAATANRFFGGRDDVWLLVIDPARLTAPLRFEDLYAHGIFPHLHGPLNRDAVLRIIPFPCETDGTFRLALELVEFAHAR